jgi:hypothetical protein
MRRFDTGQDGLQVRSVQEISFTNGLPLLMNNPEIDETLGRAMCKTGSQPDALNRCLEQGCLISTLQVHDTPKKSHLPRTNHSE